MFLTRLQLEDRAEPDLWTYVAPLVWCDPVYGRLEVPIGSITDLASIPRILRNIPALDPNGLSRRPAGMHDWLYGSKEGRRYGKQFADSFLRAALLAEGTTKGTAATFYYGVHWFGGSSWDSDGRRLSAPNPAP